MSQSPVICFVADIHLSAENKNILKRFQSFTSNISSHITELYILGDLFDYWIGDDGAAVLGFDIVIEQLQKIHQNGTEIFIQRGNRDFLLGEAFANDCGAKLISDPHTLTLAGKTILLSHGDRWCTDDKDYMQLREMVTNEDWQNNILNMSIQQRLEMAKELRQQSEISTKNKEHEIMDVNLDAVLDEARALKTKVIIHGHTHRPNTHRHDDITRYVLGDWYNQQSWIIWQDGEFFVNKPL